LMIVSFAALKSPALRTLALKENIKIDGDP
jgi:hypothetical protein